MKNYFKFTVASRGGLQGREDAERNIVDSDPFTSGLLYAQQNGDDPEAIADAALAYQRAYIRSQQSTRHNR